MIYIHIIIIILIQIIAIKYLDYKVKKLNNKENKENNNNNIININKNKIIDEINNRINLLKNMSYNEWIDYNKNNKIKMIDNVECYIFIWERTYNKNLQFEEFISRVYFDQKLENITFDLFSDIINDNISLFDHKLNKNLIKSMFYLNQKINEVSFFNISHIKDNNYIKNDVIKYNCFNQKFTKDNINGVIGIYYAYNNITKDEVFYFYEYVDIKIYLAIIISFFISILIYTFTVNYNKLLIIILSYLLNFYMIYFIFSKTTKINNQSLLTKLNDINTSTLSIAFLISANIFIINFIAKNKKLKNIYTLSIILFSLSIFYLLGSLYKILSYNTQYDIRRILFIKVLLYNLVIILNFYIILIYVLHLII